MGDIGLPEILLILAIAILIFGAGRLKDIGKGLGDGIRGFKDAMKEPPPPPPAEKK